MTTRPNLKITRYVKMDAGGDLADHIVALAANVEDAYINAGIEGYTAQDCFDKGFQLALATWRSGQHELGYQVSYPETD